MNRRQYAIVALFSVSLLTVALVPLSGQQGSSYNPWLDYNDDGIINVEDLQALGSAYGSSGAPLNQPMVLGYDSGWLDISDKQGQFWDVTHNLNSLNIFADVKGRMIEEGEVHQINLDTTGRAPGWNKTYGPSSAYSVVQTLGGGYALAGETWSYGAGLNDFWLVKTDLNGNALWNQTYGTAENEVARSVIQTFDEGYALAGYEYMGGSLKYDFWLVKTDVVGNMQWNWTYGGTGHQSPRSLIQTMDGGYAIAGMTDSYGGGGWDCYLVKTNPDGVMQWNRTYGGTDYEEAYSLIQTPDGGYALAGYTESYGAGGADFWLVRTDSTGVMIWNKTYGGYGIDRAFSVIRTLDDGYALAGTASSYDPTTSFCLVKTDALGNMEWNKTYGLGYAYSVVQTSEGGYAIAGEYVPEAFVERGKLVRTDLNGDFAWNQTYSGDVFSMVKTYDGGYALVGRTAAADCCLLKTDIFGLVGYSEYGLKVVRYILNALTFYRGVNDRYWNYMRARIWVGKKNP